MLELLDRILGVISFFDLLTPAARLTQNMVKGSAFTFRVPHRAGWGIYSVERILKDAGCEVWGKEIFGDTMILAVRREQAQRAYWALYRADVPMDNDIPEPTGEPLRGGYPGSGVLDALEQFLDR